MTNLISLNDHLYRLRLPCKQQPGLLIYPLDITTEGGPGLLTILSSSSSLPSLPLVLNFLLIFPSLKPASFLIFSEGLYSWLINDLMPKQALKEKYKRYLTGIIVYNHFPVPVTCQLLNTNNLKFSVNNRPVTIPY